MITLIWLLLVLCAVAGVVSLALSIGNGDLGAGIADALAIVVAVLFIVWFGGRRDRKRGQ